MTEGLQHCECSLRVAGGGGFQLLIHLIAREVTGKYFCIFNFFLKRLLWFLPCVEGKMTKHFDNCRMS